MAQSWNRGWFCVGVIDFHEARRTIPWPAPGGLGVEDGPHRAAPALRGEGHRRLLLHRLRLCEASAPRAPRLLGLLDGLLLALDDLTGPEVEGFQQISMSFQGISTVFNDVHLFFN